MSSVEEGVFSWVDNWQWLCMVTLFLASVVTLIIYLVQYFSIGRSVKRTSSHVDFEEADGILSWVLSLKSWKGQWRKAWFRSLNEEARSSQSGIQLTFEEDDVQSSELAIGQISSFTKTRGQKNVRCHVAGNKLQFSLTALPSSTSSEVPLRYNVTISPLRLQLALQMTEVNGEVEISWGLQNLDSVDVQLTPSLTQGNYGCLSEAAVKNKLTQVLCATCPSVTLSSKHAEVKQEVRNKTSQVTSPPKPPRAHEWKLLVKNIQVTCKQEDGAAGGINPQCLLQLDDPPQNFTTEVLTNTSNPAWDQPFIFELSGRSKELNIQVVDNSKPRESGLLGQVSVPFDLVKKHPKGQQTFSLMTKDQVTGSLTTEFTYLEPSEVRSWQPPTPAPAKRVEMDRTVMPCGTVVTTVTAVRSKPGRPLPPVTESKSPLKSKLAERRVSEQTSLLGAKVSKALSSSDTELLMLNGSDPVAEAAIRQLHESAKQKLKSPVKKSTIIISGVTKTPVTPDDEMVMMAGYAAAMDASMSGASEVFSSETVPSDAAAEPSVLEHPESVVGTNGTDHVEDWESQTGEYPDADKTSLSYCPSETGSKKGKGSFLHKSAKLFFRRRHQRKEPGMSQSHNDLQYLENPETAMVGDRETRTATFRRIINRKLLPKSKSKPNGTMREPNT